MVAHLGLTRRERLRSAPWRVGRSSSHVCIPDLDSHPRRLPTGGHRSRLAFVLPARLRLGGLSWTPNHNQIAGKGSDRHAEVVPRLRAAGAPGQAAPRRDLGQSVVRMSSQEVACWAGW